MSEVGLEGLGPAVPPPELLAPPQVPDAAQRLAQRLHDDLAQLLTLALIQIDEIRSDDADRARLAHERARQLVRLALHSVRYAIDGLKKDAIDDLPRALAERAEQLSQQCGSPIAFSSSLTGPELPPDVAELMLAAASELMINACKHAPGVPLHVAIARHGRGVALIVRDHGPGFDPQLPAAAGSGLGLSSLRERLQDMGLDLMLQAAPGLGVHARIIWEPESFEP